MVQRDCVDFTHTLMLTDVIRTFSYNMNIIIFSRTRMEVAEQTIISPIKQQNHFTFIQTMCFAEEFSVFRNNRKMFVGPSCRFE